MQRGIGTAFETASAAIKARTVMARILANFSRAGAVHDPIVGLTPQARPRRAAHPATILLICAAAIVLAALGMSQLTAGDPPNGSGTKNGGNPIMNDKLKIATFAGGCFWCMEPPFDKVDGVISTISGYTGGHTVNPTYEEVSSGTTGHAESLQVTYDPTRVSYEKLLEVFWHNIDPLARDRQFCDVGEQYRSAIFYHDEEQKRLAEASKQELVKSGRFKQTIATEIVAATQFYPAEEYHQDYYKKNPIRYKFYRFNCGRDQRLKELWGTPQHEF